MVRSVPRVTWGWYPASRMRSITWLISCSVAFSDMFTIMELVLLISNFAFQKTKAAIRGSRLAVEAC
jgi:hypothetical protein